VVHIYLIHVLIFPTSLFIAASDLDSLHMRHLFFSGRMIGLALMHKIHVGVFLDRTLFLQLAGWDITG